MTDLQQNLKNLKELEDHDSRFIIAAAINLYTESLRRISGRAIYGPDDIPTLLDLIDTLLTKRNLVPLFTPTRKITKEDETKVLEAVEEAVKPIEEAIEALPPRIKRI